MAWRIILLAVTLVGGRYLWIWAWQPSHRLELADAYSVSLFYETPQSDSQGRQVTYVGTADHGFAAFLVETATGRKVNVREQNALGPWGSYFDLQVWPWAPDDSAFLVSAGTQLQFCEPTTGIVRAEVNLSSEVASLAWLRPDALVCIGKDDTFYQLVKQSDGTWRAVTTLRPDRAPAQVES